MAPCSSSVKRTQRQPNMSKVSLNTKVILLCKIVLASVFQCSTMVRAATSESYRAAVFEHVRFGDIYSPVEEVLGANLKSYEIAAELAAENHVDIIVFPEFGLFPHTRGNRSVVRQYAENIPDPSKMGPPPNPCDQKDIYKDRVILNTLSCLAKRHHLFLVANMVDTKQCEGSCNANELESCNNLCPDDGQYLHNTNVVFDRSGNLVTRYYKRHPYFEFDLNEASDVHHAYFKTDFGTFTTFICFDMSFHDSVDAVTSSDVINVAYPTYWYDHQPFAMATQFQQSWAMTLNVNLLASNVHLPGTGTLGSGIYSGSRGALVYTHNPDSRDKLLIADVPTKPGNDIASNSKRYLIEDGDVVEVQDEIPVFGEHCAEAVLGKPSDFSIEYRCALTNISVYEFKKLQGVSGSIETCSNELCCHLEYESVSLDEDYFFGSYSDSFNFYNAFEFGMQACLLARCSGNTCTVFPTRASTVFRRVKIQAKFLTPYVYPSVLHSGFRLAPTTMWTYDVDQGLEYNNPSEINEVNAPLLVAGLYARRYDLDKVL